MSDDLGFAAPVLRRDLTALRSALETVRAGVSVTATFRHADHGRFAVSGRVRRDLTDTVFTVGWFDLTNGKRNEPVSDLQTLVVASEDDDAPHDAVEPDAAELRRVISTLELGHVVTADFDFEGCGAFAVAGEIRREAAGGKWILAGHHLSYGDVPAPRLRRLVVERRAVPPDAEAGRYDLFGAEPVGAARA